MDNLEDIKVGDKVVAYYRYGKVIRTVVRLTKTLIVLDDAYKFRKSDGFLSGIHGFYIPRIKMATHEDIVIIEDNNKRKEIIEAIRDYPLDKLSTETLKRIHELIKK